MDIQLIYRGAELFFVLNLLALVAVLFVGTGAYNTKRWLDLGLLYYQPSETMKLILIFVLAKSFSKAKVKREGLNWTSLLLPFLICFLPFMLILNQPDLGTAGLLILVFMGMTLFMGIQKKVLVVTLMSAIVATPLIWSFGLKGYQQKRIISFVSPGKDPKGTNYNSIQSKISVGSGRLLGKGFRKGSQSQLEFLPERHTDFIFSVLSEETGFVGSFFTLLLFNVLFILILYISTHAKDRFAAMTCVGIMSYIALHTFINISMVLGLFPIVGIPLPLVSYGGSSMLTTMTALGVVSNISYHRYFF